MKSSQILRMAKRRLAKAFADVDRDIFICFALRNVSRDTGDMVVMAKAEKIKELIMHRLKGCFTLDDWLVNYAGINHYRVSEGVNKMQRTRHAWVDSLIVEFEAKGD
jgi:hypothetical protein